MFTVPVATPVTTPAELTVAIDELLLVHVPPDGEELSVVFDPTHTLAVPDIEPGRAIIVTVCTAVHPLTV